MTKGDVMGQDHVTDAGNTFFAQEQPDMMGRNVPWRRKMA